MTAVRQLRSSPIYSCREMTVIRQRPLRALSWRDVICPVDRFYPLITPVALSGLVIRLADIRFRAEDEQKELGDCLAKVISQGTRVVVGIRKA
jgi:hypothetical protein